MSNARKLADNLPTEGSLSGRNVVVNGAMNLSQRGTSFASVGNVYTLDRFAVYKQNTGAAFTVTQSSVTDLAGFANSLKMDCTTADTSIASNEEIKILHKFEGQNLQGFQKGHATALGFTLSFYVKTNKTGVYCVELYDRDNGREVSGSYTVANANWNRYTISFPADTTGKFDDDNASSLEMSFWLVAGSAVQGGTLNTTWRSAADASSATGQVNFADSTSNDWEITGVQLEVGSEATPFEHPRSVGDEIARCQRYFYNFQPAGTATSGGDETGIVGCNYNGNNFFGSIYFPVTMRAAPALSSGGDWASRDGNNNLLASVFSYQRSSPRMALVSATATSVTAGNALWVEPSSGTNPNTAFMDFDAEL